MISKALQFTSDMLNQFLVNRFSLSEKVVLLNNVIEPDGTIPQKNQNKVVLSLINIEKETLKPFYVRNQRMPDGSFADINPAERYNLDMLITSNFEDYQETLRFLNASLMFFQINQAVDHTASSAFPENLEKLEFEFQKLTFHQMQGLWNSMGAKYQPSVVFRMRLINIQGNEPSTFYGQVLQTSNTVEA